MSELDFFFPAGAAGRDPIRRSIPHLLVFVPGIAGSALRTARGEVIWGVTGKVAKKAVRLPELLAGPGGRLADPDYDDGVRAFDLLAVPIPGLTRLFGFYHGIRATLGKEFELTDLNYLEFPYDWRRPVGVGSARLATAIEERLCALRERRPEAKVIIIAHSMGGLLARHYLQNHDKAGDCARVLTLGTPFRGAVKALDYLVNGPKTGPLRFRFLAETLRRVPSIYELLPMYRSVIDHRGAVPAEAQRVGDIVGALDLDAGQVRRSREFLRELNTAGERTGLLQPLVGFGSATVQQAMLYEGRLVASEKSDLLPAEYGVSGGDGTVPALSARPGGAPGVTVRYADQSHLGMVMGRSALKALTYMVRETLDALEHDPALGPADAGLLGQDPGVPPHGPALTVQVADYYEQGEPVVIAGHTRVWSPGRSLWAQLDSRGVPQPVGLAEDGSFSVDFGLVEEGLHTLALMDAPDGPALLGDVVEVA